MRPVTADFRKVPPWVSGWELNKFLWKDVP